MARFIPSQPPAGIEKSERLVWEGLRALGDRWVVHHGVQWQGKRDGRQNDGEADFVLVHPDHGVLIAEVKGGTIDITPDGWWSTGEQGRFKIKNPFNQAQASKRTLMRFLRERLAPCPFIPFGHFAVFPTVPVLPRLGPEAPDEIAWRKVEVEDAAIAMEALCEHWDLQNPIGEDLAEAISDALAPSGTIRVRRSDEIANVNAQIDSWTREQIEVLNSFADNSRLMVNGGAGTGKTALAMERALDCAADDQSVLLTCYNRPLGLHIAEEIQGAANVTASHFHKLCSNLASEAYSETGRDEFLLPEKKSTAFWEHDAPALLVEAADALEIAYDTIIVDEGQDFSPEWFEALEALLASDESQWIVFADSHQAIYRSGWKQPFTGSKVRLFKNCRNTREIASRVAAVWGDDVDARGAIGRPPEFHATESFEGSRAALRGVLHRLLNDGGLAPSQIVVLCEKKRGVLSLRGDELAGVKLGASRNGGSVWVETIHRFKGLEADAVVVILESPELEDRSLLYTGLSRASAELFVLGPSDARHLLNWS